jgi:hypothetical protein
MDFAATLLLGLICLVIGVLIGALIFNRPRSAGTDPLLARTSPPPEKGGVWLRRERRSQRLSVAIEGDVYQSASQLSPDRRRLLTNLAADFSTWLGLLPGQGSVVPPKVEQPSPGIQPEAEAIQKAEPAGRSIAAQIDEILQERLEGTPLAGRGIRIIELPGQGMVVMVGLEKYSDLEQIGDPDVRRAIGGAVAEWEARSTLKK